MSLNEINKTISGIHSIIAILKLIAKSRERKKNDSSNVTLPGFLSEFQHTHTRPKKSEMATTEPVNADEKLISFRFILAVACCARMHTAKPVRLQLLSSLVASLIIYVSIYVGEVTYQPTIAFHTDEKDEGQKIVFSSFSLPLITTVKIGFHCLSFI